jgi:hypothetical protein
VARPYSSLINIRYLHLARFETVEARTSLKDAAVDAVTPMKILADYLSAPGS